MCSWFTPATRRRAPRLRAKRRGKKTKNPAPSFRLWRPVGIGLGPTTHAPVGMLELGIMYPDEIALRRWELSPEYAAASRFRIAAIVLTLLSAAYLSFGLEN